MLLLPYGTTCYKETPAWGTRWLLVANAIVFAGVFVGLFDPGNWVQLWRRPLHPSLVGSAFLHLDRIHLLSNLAYLWIVGRIVEGTIGMRSFLLLSFGIILGANVAEAVILCDRDGGSYGASGLACGLLTAAFLLAPRSRVHCIILFFHPIRFSMPLGGFAALILGIELLFAAVTGFEPSSAFLHVTGATVGVLLAFLGLKRGWWDSGGWDWLSLQRRSEHPPSLTLERAEEAGEVRVSRCTWCGRPRPSQAKPCRYCGTK